MALLLLIIKKDKKMAVEFLKSKKIENLYKEIENKGFFSKNKKKNIVNKVLKKYHLDQHELYYVYRNKDKNNLDYINYRKNLKKTVSKKKQTYFPQYLLIEPTSICNLRCVMCFQQDKSFSSNKKYMGKMDINLFKEIIDQAEKGGTKSITLASRGEPTLNSNLPEMLDYIKGKFLELKLNTNGTLLSENLSREILKAGVNDLVFSIDSHEKAKYEKIRVKGKFNKVLENIKKFLTIRENEFPEHTTTVRVSGVKVSKNLDKNEFNEFWNELVDYSVLVNLEQRWDTYNNEIQPKNNLLPCDYLWKQMYVWWDGTVNPCDIDYKSSLAIGSLKNNSIKDLWNSEKYNALRQKHLSGNRTDYSVCSKCNAWSKNKK